MSIAALSTATVIENHLLLSNPTQKHIVKACDVHINTANFVKNGAGASFTTQISDNIKSEMVMGIELISFNIPKMPKPNSESGTNNTMSISTWPVFFRTDANSKKVMYTHGRSPLIHLSLDRTQNTHTPILQESSQEEVTTTNEYIDGGFNAPFLHPSDFNEHPTNFITNTIESTVVGFLNGEFSKFVAYEKDSQDGVKEILGENDIYYDKQSKRKLWAKDVFVPGVDGGDVRMIQPMWHHTGYLNYTNFLRCAMKNWGLGCDTADTQFKSRSKFQTSTYIPEAKELFLQTVESIDPDEVKLKFTEESNVGKFVISKCSEGHSLEKARFYSGNNSFIFDTNEINVVFRYTSTGSSVPDPSFPLIHGAEYTAINTEETETPKQITLLDNTNNNFYIAGASENTLPDGGVYELYSSDHRPGYFVSSQNPLGVITALGVITDAYVDGGLRVTMIYGTFSGSDQVSIGEPIQSLFEREVLKRWFDADAPMISAEYDNETNRHSTSDIAGHWKYKDHFKLFRRDSNTENFKFELDYYERPHMVITMGKAIAVSLFLNKYPEVFYDQVGDDGTLITPSTKINTNTFYIPPGDLDLAGETRAGLALGDQLQRHIQKIATNIESHRDWVHQVRIDVSGHMNFARDNTDHLQLGYQIRMSFFYDDHHLFDFDNIILEITQDSSNLGLVKNQVTFPSITSPHMFPEDTSIVEMNNRSFMEKNNNHFYLVSQNPMLISKPILYMHIETNGSYKISAMSSATVNNKAASEAANGCFCTLYLNLANRGGDYDSFSHAVVFPEQPKQISSLNIQFRNINNEIIDVDEQDIFLNLRLYYSSIVNNRRDS